jgi:hypothetical protein
VAAAAAVNRRMRSTTRVAIEPIKDYTLSHEIEGIVIETRAMELDRSAVGAFQNGHIREAPVLISDDPDLP